MWKYGGLSRTSLPSEMCMNKVVGASPTIVGVSRRGRDWEQTLKKGHF